jgi:hypothetical protein
MTDHFGYLNSLIICGTCGNVMNLSSRNDNKYEPGKPIKWIVVCENQVCPHVGVSYQVQPQVVLKPV